MPPPEPTQLTILVFVERERWVAQCLQLDIAAQGSDIDDALEAWMLTFASQIISDAAVGRVPFSNVPPAPPEYFERSRAARPTSERHILRLPSDVPAQWTTRTLDAEVRVA